MFEQSNKKQRSIREIGELLPAVSRKMKRLSHSLTLIPLVEVVIPETSPSLLLGESFDKSHVFPNTEIQTDIQQKESKTNGNEIFKGDLCRTDPTLRQILNYLVFLITHLKGILFPVLSVCKKTALRSYF
jgi:hypothetical protein